MDTKELEEVVEKHVKWLNGETDGAKANLRGADLETGDNE